MQKKSRAARARFEINGHEYPGLNELGALSSTKGEIAAGYPGGQETISDGQIKWAPLEGSYLDRNDSDVASELYDLYNKNELADLTYIELDAHGVETRRWLVPDAECVNTNHLHGTRRVSRRQKLNLNSYLIKRSYNDTPTCKNCLRRP